MRIAQRVAAHLPPSVKAKKGSMSGQRPFKIEQFYRLSLVIRERTKVVLAFLSREDRTECSEKLGGRKGALRLTKVFVIIFVISYIFTIISPRTRLAAKSQLIELFKNLQQKEFQHR